MDIFPLKKNLNYDKFKNQKYFNLCFQKSVLSLKYLELSITIERQNIIIINDLKSYIKIINVMLKF